MNQQQALEILGLDTATTPEAVKRAYWNKAHLVHPDKNRGDAAACAKFIAVKEAYDLLAARPTVAATDGAARVRYSYQRGSRRPLSVSVVDLDALRAAGEWGALRHCAELASNRAVRDRAVELLAAAGRFFDLLALVRATDDEQLRAVILRQLEQHIERIVNFDFPQATSRDLRGLTDFVLEQTDDLRVAGRVLALYRANAMVPRLSRIRDLAVAELALRGMLGEGRLQQLEQELARCQAFGRSQICHLASQLMGIDLQRPAAQRRAA